MDLLLAFSHIKSVSKIKKEYEEALSKSAQLRDVEEITAEEPRAESTHFQSRSSTKRLESSSHSIKNPNHEIMDKSTGIVFKVKPSVSTKTAATASSKRLEPAINHPNGKAKPSPLGRVTPKRPSRLEPNPSPKPSPGKASPKTVTTPKQTPRVSISGTKIAIDTPNAKVKSNVKCHNSVTNVSTSTYNTTPRKPPVPKTLGTPGRPSAPLKNNSQILSPSPAQPFDTFGIDREQQVELIRRAKLKALIFDAFIRNIVDAKAEVAEKKEILNILQTKRILDAWSSLTARNSAMESEFKELAEEFYKVIFILRR